MAQHPTFKLPTILEALCEVHFRLTPDRPWTATRPGAFFQSIIDDYPALEPITEQGVQFTFGSNNIAQQELLAPRLKFKFTHRDTTHPTLLQISNSTFAVNCLDPYPGWEKMKATLMDAWPKFRNEAQPAQITRIGLRYINRIRRRSKDEQPAFWLKQTDMIPRALLESREGFSYRLEVRRDNKSRIITSIPHVQGPEMGQFGALLFDIDRILETELNVDNQTLDAAVERLHEDVWKVFLDAKNKNYDLLLRGKLDVTG